MTPFDPQQAWPGRPYLEPEHSKDTAAAEKLEMLTMDEALLSGRRTRICIERCNSDKGPSMMHATGTVRSCCTQSSRARISLRVSS